MATVTFEWDPGKAMSNQRKHNVSFEEAMTALNDPMSATGAGAKENEGYMKKASQENKDELRPEYKLSDFPKGFVRGKYFDASRKNANLVLLSPDVARVFPTDEAVNEALRSLIDLAQKSTGLKKRSPRGARAKKTA